MSTAMEHRACPHEHRTCPSPHDWRCRRPDAIIGRADALMRLTAGKRVGMTGGLALFASLCACTWSGAAGRLPTRLTGQAITARNIRQYTGLVQHGTLGLRGGGIWAEVRNGLNAVVRENDSRESSALESGPFSTAVSEVRGNEVSSSEKEGSYSTEEEDASDQSDVSVELTSIIGFGSFSTVYAGETKRGEAVAVKRVQRQNTEEVLKRLQREIRIQSRIHHPNIVRLLRVIEDDECVSLVQERCKGGELFDFVNDFQTFHANGERSWRRTNTTLVLTVTEEHIAKMIRQILLAVDYMHSEHDVVHRDLKLENVMLSEPFAVDKEPVVKVVDLGFAKEVSGGNTMMTACGSTLYIAPEVLTAKTTGMGYGKECDLWAVGVMAYILICCRPPFSGATSWHVGQAIQKGAYTYPDYALVTDGAKQLIAGLLQVNPGKRLTAKEALNMPWIASVAPAEEKRQVEVGGSTLPTRQSSLLTPSAHPSPSPIPPTKAGETASGEEEEGGETDTETPSPSLPSWLRNIVNALAGGMRDIEEHHTHHSPLDHHTHHTDLAPIPA